MLTYFASISFAMRAISSSSLSPKGSSAVAVALLLLLFNDEAPLDNFAIFFCFFYNKKSIKYK